MTTRPLPPAITIVIPSWNRSDVLPRAIRSVLSQTIDDFELIVVDDGSTDHTSALSAEFDDDRLSWVEQPHAGVSVARNTGAAEAAGTFLTFLDSDDEADPAWLETMLSALRGTTAQVAICGATRVAPDGRTDDFSPSPGKLSPDEMSGRFLAGCMAIRTALFHEAGGFDPQIRFGENTELALRLYSRYPDLQVTAIPRALVRIHLRDGPPDRTAQEEGAEVVLARYRRSRFKFPVTWASYNAIVGTGNARRGRSWKARHHFWAAVRADPGKREHHVRLLASLVPGMTPRLWPPDRKVPAVLFVVLAPGVGGSVRSLATVLAHNSGVRRVVARPEGTSTAEFLTARRLVDDEVDLSAHRAHRVWTRALGVLVLVRWSWKLRGQLSAIHANGLAELNLAVLPALVARCRVVVWVHEWEVSVWTRRLAPLWRVLAPTARFAAVSEHSRQMLLSDKIVSPDRVTVVSNPIDPDDVAAGNEPDHHSRVRVAYVGTPALYKGFHLLPAIVRAAEGSDIDWWAFAGPDRMMPETFAELRDLGVSLPGKVQDVRRIYGTSDIVVVPSLHESFGRVAAEAMANGIPVVASNLPPLRDLLGDDEAGLLAPAGDVAAFAAAVTRLALDPALRTTLGMEGLARSRRFDPARVTNQLMDLYGLGQPRTRR